MIDKKNWLALIILVSIIINFFPVSIVSGNNAKVTDLLIHVPNSQQLTQHNRPVWIRGVWHYINITLNNDIDEISIIFYYGNNPQSFDEKDETNYYKWEHDQKNWEDIQHGSKYIKEEYCYHQSGFFSFYIGIDQYAEVGNWTLEILVNGKLSSSRQIYVGKAVTAISLKTIPVTIRAEPFEEGYYKSEEKFTVENKGNMPLTLKIDYGKYSDIFSTVNLDGIFKPNQVGKYSILLNSRSTWPPGVLKIESGEISLIGEALYIIPPKEMVNLIESNVASGLPIDLYIGHLGYELESLAGDITFQYIKNLDISHNEVKDIYVYISGNGQVTIDITSKNLVILKILSGGVEVNTPFTFKSTNTSEYPIAVRVRSNRPNSTAYLYYDLESSGEHKKFTTKINVGSPLPKKRYSPDLLIIQIFTLSCVIILMIYLIYSQIRIRRR